MKSENKLILGALLVCLWLSGYSVGKKSMKKEGLVLQEPSPTVEGWDEPRIRLVPTDETQVGENVSTAKKPSEADVRALLEAGRAMTKLSELEVWAKSVAEVDLRKNRGSYLAAAGILESSGFKWEVSGTGWSNGWDDQIYLLSTTRDGTRYYFKYFYPETDGTEVSFADGKGSWMEDGGVELAAKKWVEGAYKK